jgi:hypothetical protein
MKIAGRKNDGAWFRTNQAIQKLNEDERANLAGSIDNSPFIDAAYNHMTALIAEVGIAGIAHATNTLQWAQSFANDGIPRQVWFGNLSWDTYTKQPRGGFGQTGFKYVKNGEFAMREFANDLRKICTRYFLARRQVRDIFNAGSAAEGNVGGLPDTNKLT